MWAPRLDLGWEKQVIWRYGLVMLSGSCRVQHLGPYSGTWSGCTWGSWIPLECVILPLPCPGGTFPFTSVDLTWGTHCPKTFSLWLKEFSVEQTQVCYLQWYLEDLLLEGVLTFAFRAHWVGACLHKGALTSGEGWHWRLSWGHWAPSRWATLQRF